MAVVTYSGIAFESLAFPGKFLRMDGNGVTSMTGPGGGKVNCQGFTGPWERFQFIQQADGSTAINSIAFPKAFLRMDGSNVTKFEGSGGGVVNCQGGVGSWEKFKVVINQSTLQLTVESRAFPNRFLRMDASGVPASAPGGGGTVNCQWGAFGWEQFVLRFP